MDPITGPDDPRLDGWYHTIELGGGLVSRGSFDHRTIVDRYGLPESLAGLSALDVGTADGFWAFELERRGADRVVACDIDRYADFDWLPHIRAAMGPESEHPRRGYFDLAHHHRGSAVDYHVCSVYDLSPERFEPFDLVFCGSLLLHLQNPLAALGAIRSVTAGVAVIEVHVNEGLDSLAEQHRSPLLAFGHRALEEAEGMVLGQAAVYWQFTSRALAEMLEYAGFSAVEPRGLVRIPPGGHPVAVVHARP